MSHSNILSYSSFKVIYQHLLVVSMGGENGAGSAHGPFLEIMKPRSVAAESYSFGRNALERLEVHRGIAAEIFNFRIFIL